MKITFLGTGTSVGVPMIGCDCDVCKSADPRNTRLRSSIFLQAGGADILVDAAPDFRTQALQNRIRHIDAVVFTHSHADHIFGFDEIRRFNTIQDCLIPAYGSPAAVADLKRVFNYVVTAKPEGLFRPIVEFREIVSPLKIKNLNIVPVQVTHGPEDALGYLFEADGRRFGYVPDCSAMPEAGIEILKGADLMVLDALRHRPHIAHFTVEESVGILRRICAKKSFLIHMCHDLDHVETEKSLPDGIRLSYDGLKVEL